MAGDVRLLRQQRVGLDPPDEDGYALVMSLASGELDDVAAIAQALRRWAR